MKGLSTIATSETESSHKSERTVKRPDWQAATPEPYETAVWKAIRWSRKQTVWQNCYISDTRYGFNRPGGELCNRCEEGLIENCYVYGKHSNLYSLANTANNSIFRNSYYPGNSYKGSVNPDGYSNTKKNILHFTPDKTDKLIELLNAWTDSINSLLPQPEFLNWQKADNPPAILIVGQ